MYQILIKLIENKKARGSELLAFFVTETVTVLKHRLKRNIIY